MEKAIKFGLKVGGIFENTTIILGGLALAYVIGRGK